VLTVVVLAGGDGMDGGGGGGRRIIKGWIWGEGGACEMIRGVGIGDGWLVGVWGDACEIGDRFLLGL